MKAWVKRWAVGMLLLSLLPLSACAQQSGSRGVLYRVTGGAQPMYLLGSIHIGSESMYPFGPEIAAAMDASSMFVFECDTADQAATLRMAARQLLPSGETLRGHIGDELYQKVEETYERLGIDATGLDLCAPWAVSNALALYATSAELGTADVKQAISLGVEEQVRAYVARQKKPVAYLETLDAQIDVLAGFSDAVQRYMLSGECDIILDPGNATPLDASIGKWPEWWYNGDAQAFADAYLAGTPDPAYPAESEEYHLRLVTERNRSMAQTLDGILKNGDAAFVTVGLLHLVLPEDSIVKHLRELGYTVERVA